MPGRRVDNEHWLRGTDYARPEPKAKSDLKNRREKERSRRIKKTKQRETKKKKNTKPKKKKQQKMQHKKSSEIRWEAEREDQSRGGSDEGEILSRL